MAGNRFCSACGTPLGDSDRFCGSCGAVVAAADPEPDEPPAAEPARPEPAPTEAAAPPPEPEATPPVAAPAGPPPTDPAEVMATDGGGGGFGRAARTALLVALGIAVPALVGLAVYILIADDDDSVATAPATTPVPSLVTTTDVTPATDPVPATTGAPATTQPSDTTAPATTAPATTAPASTAPATTQPPPTTAPPPTAPPRDPVSLPVGDPATCERQVGTGGRLATIDARASGFDVAIAAELVQRVWSTTSVCYFDIPVADRFTALDAGDIHLLVRSVTETTSTNQLAAPTQPYLMDGLAVAVRPDTGATPDLAGLTVGSVAGRPDGDLLVNQTELLRLREYESPTALATAFQTGEVDALASGWVFLQSVYGANPAVEVIFLDITFEPNSVYVPIGADPRREALDGALAAMIADGTWEQIFIAEFGFEPWYDPAGLVDLEPLPG